MNAPTPLTRKLEKLETLVDALLESQNGLRDHLEKIRDQSESSGGTGEANVSGKMLDELERLRSRLADSEANNQQLVRERNGVRERLTQIRNRLDQVEAQLLEKRSASSASKS